MKVCRKCCTEKTTTEFFKHPRVKDGLGSWCKQCSKESSRKSYRETESVRQAAKTWRSANPEKVKEASRKHYYNNREKELTRHRRYRLLTNYGMTLESYDEMVKLQNGRCLICQDLPKGRWGVLHVDHCHETGKVRGLLCVGCNKALGFLNDNPDLAEALADYLELHARLLP